MTTYILNSSEDTISSFQSALPQHQISFFNNAIELVKTLERCPADALILPNHSEEVDICDLLEAARSVSPGIATLTVGLPKEMKKSLRLINAGRPDHILCMDEKHLWHGQIARSVVQKAELKNALKENERLEKNNSQLEFHVRQFMLAESGF